MMACQIQLFFDNKKNNQFSEAYSPLDLDVLALSTDL
jgi:hypothetical protein